MQLEKRIVGITYAYDCEDEYSAIKEANIHWVRMGLVFPWEDEMCGRLSKEYLSVKEELKKAKRVGMKVMLITPGFGCLCYVKEEGITKWVDSWPEFCGKKGSEEFYDNVRITNRFFVEDLHGISDSLWQVCNELDLHIFRGDNSLDDAIKLLKTSAEGILEWDSEAMIGINNSDSVEEAEYIMNNCYKDSNLFSYIGIDKYFGSWVEGEVQDWVLLIDDLHEKTGKPVLINEWGYASSGEIIKPSEIENIPNGWTRICVINGWHNSWKNEHSPKVAADYIKIGLKIFATYPNVLGSFIFCWKDAKQCYHCGQAGCPGECSWGLVDTESKPKPAYYAVKDTVEKYY